MSPKILLETNKETKNSKSEEKKKSNGCTASFFFFFLLLFEGRAVTLFKNPALIYIFLTLARNRNLI